MFKKFFDELPSIEDMLSGLGIAAAVGGIGYMAWWTSKENAKQRAERQRIFDEALYNPRYESLPNYRWLSRTWDGFLNDYAKDVVHIEDDIERAQEQRYAAARNGDDDKNHNAHYRVRSLRDSLDSKKRDIATLNKNKNRLDEVIRKLEGNDRIGRAAGLY